MKIRLLGYSFYDNNIEDVIENIFKDNINSFKQCNCYNITMIFYNPIKKVGNIDWVDFDIDDIEQYKIYNKKINIIKTRLNNIGININNLYVYGSSSEIKEREVQISVEKSSSKKCNNDITFINNKELYIYKHNVLFLKKLLKRNLITQEEYNNSVKDIKDECGILS